MQRISYEEVRREPFSVTKTAEFRCEDIGEERTYESIYNKFINYRFDDFVNEIKEEMECQSYSYIIFLIVFEEDDGKKDETLMYSARLGIPNRHEVEYDLEIVEDREILQDRYNHVNLRFLINNYKKVYVKALVDTLFYIHSGLDIYEQYEDDDDDEDPPKLELAFRNDKCSICLDNKSDVLILPCLHISVCSLCDNIGNLTKCSVCRGVIFRKIKI